MNEQELEAKILDFSKEPLTKSKLTRLVGGDKQTCFKKINAMVQTGQLRSVKQGNQEIITRIDTTNHLEFDYLLNRIIEELKTSRGFLTIRKKPMFYKSYTILHTIPPLVVKNNMKESRKRGREFIKNPKKFKIEEEIPVWKTRQKNVTKNLEFSMIYVNALLMIIDRTNLQKNLSVIRKPESKRRINLCENALAKHFKKLFKENPKDEKGLRQWFLWNDYKIERFKIF